MYRYVAFLINSSLKLSYIFIQQFYKLYIVLKYHSLILDFVCKIWSAFSFTSLSYIKINIKLWYRQGSDVMRRLTADIAFDRSRTYDYLATNSQAKSRTHVLLSKSHVFRLLSPSLLGTCYKLYLPRTNVGQFSRRAQSPL